jgi:hypothetical protein
MVRKYYSERDDLMEMNIHDWIFVLKMAFEHADVVPGAFSFQDWRPIAAYLGIDLIHMTELVPRL